jgi:hypothetical protein
MRPTGLLYLTLVACGGAAEVTWDSILRLTTDPASQVTGFSGQHAVAVDGSGNVHVAWLDQRTVPYEVWYRRFDAGARVWMPETMLANRPANCFKPGIACDSTGNVHVAWHLENWQGPGIWYKRYDATARRWKPDTLLDTTTTVRPQQYPSAACVPGTGNLALAWYGLSDTGQSFQVFFKERHAAGWDSAMQVTMASVNHDQVSVAAGSTGDVAIVWCGMDLGSMRNQVLCRRRVAGVWQDVELVSEFSDDVSQYAPGVAMDKDDAVHVVWHGRTSSNIYQHVFHRQRDSGGWQGIDSVSSERPYQQQVPAIACDAAGRCHVVWCSKGGTDHMQLAYVQRDTDGVWSSPLILTARESGDVDEPSVACDSDSGVHIVWTDASSGNQDVYYLRGSLSGAGACEEVPAPQASGLRQSPSILRGRLPVARSLLIDVCGRTVACPQFGALPLLPPGVYFTMDATGRAGPTRIVVLK